MCSCSQSKVTDILTDVNARRLKEGAARTLKSGFCGHKWVNCWLALFSDSTLCMYRNKEDKKPLMGVLLKDKAPYTCVGLMTDRMPVKRPDLPDGASVHHLVAIGMDPKAQTVHWILFSSDSELESWFTEISKTFPAPSQPSASNAPTQPPPAAQPPAYSGQNPPSGSNGQYNGPGGNATTVVIDRGGYENGGGLGFGSGMLMGGLLGYGIGSFFSPPVVMGGGGAENNDTTITNNYYNTGVQNDDQPQNEQVDNEDVGNQEDFNDQDAAGDDGYDDYDAGGLNDGFGGDDF